MTCPANNFSCLCLDLVSQAYILATQQYSLSRGPAQGVAAGEVVVDCPDAT